PELLPDIFPFLKSPLPEIRAEAANAVGQASQGWSSSSTAPIGTTGNTPHVHKKSGVKPAAGAVNLEAAAAATASRLSVETEGSVRGALCQTIGRLPYTTPEQVQRAESLLVGALGRDESVEGRLGIAQGLEALIRLRRPLSPPSARALTTLEELAAPSSSDGLSVRTARVGRVALEALIAADAVQQDVVERAAAHPDAQVRRLAMRAASLGSRDASDTYTAVLRRGLTDPSPLVRLEALRSAQVPGSAGARPEACPAAITATNDQDEHLVLLALDELAGCSSFPGAVALLEQTVTGDGISDSGFGI